MDIGISVMKYQGDFPSSEDNTKVGLSAGLGVSLRVAKHTNFDFALRHVLNHAYRDYTVYAGEASPDNGLPDDIGPPPYYFMYEYGFGSLYERMYNPTSFELMIRIRL